MPLQAVHPKYYGRLNAVSCSGASESLCSPSGRASSANSTWGASHSCLPVGWISSGSNGGDPSLTSPSKRKTLQATATPQIAPYLHLGQMSNGLTFDLLLPDPVVADSPEGGNGTGPECCPVASEVFMTGRQQRLCELTHPPPQRCKSNPIVLSFRSRMGQLGDPPSEPHHRHLCPL